MERKVKFSVTTGGLLKQAAALIFLSAATVESLQCYWCGPLAEQVHRSRRASSCDEPGRPVTTCDTGYTHCAVVATSPPFTESRYCVKFYQDECYSLYCNTTKTFRMTCPCRGDLCNGVKTKREIDAFMKLAIVSKTATNRIIKRNADNLDEIRNTTLNIDAPPEIGMPNSGVEHDISENIKILVLNESTDSNSLPMEVNNEQMNESKINSTMNNDKEDANKTESSEAKMQGTEQSTTEDKNINIEPTTTSKPTEPTIISTQTLKPMNADGKPNMVPTAEALQQNSANVATSEKPMHQMTTETISTTIANNKNNMKPMPTNATRNNANAIFTGSLLIIKCLVVKITI